MNIPRTIGECFKLEIKVEEKLKQRSERKKNRGGSSMSGRGGRIQFDSSSHQDKDKDKGSTSETMRGLEEEYLEVDSS